MKITTKLVIDNPFTFVTQKRFADILVFLSSFCVSSLILRNDGKVFQVVYIF